MGNEFTNSRVRKQLSVYRTQLDVISEEFESADYDRKKELMDSIRTICKEIECELDRATKKNTTEIDLETANYIPALQEAILYLEKALAPESDQSVSGCIHDASFSLGYYLSHA